MVGKDYTQASTPSTVLNSSETDRNMFKVYNGNWRGLGTATQENWLRVSFEFRDHLHHFKGAKLSVFMAICLHADQNGRCYPSYDTLEKETGLGRATIAKAMDALCSLTIDGHRVLCKWRERDESGKFVGSNQYQIFPTEQELREFDPEFTFSNSGESERDQSSLFPTLENETLSRTIDKEETTSFADAKGTAPVSDNEEQSHYTVMEEEDTSTTKSTKGRKRKQTSNNSLSEKPPTEHQLYFGTVCEVLGWDHSTLTKASSGQVAQTLGILKKAGYTREDVQRWFNDIWMEDWLWQKFGKYPTVKQLREGIGKIRQQTPEAPPTQAMQVNYTMESLYGDD